MTIRIIRKYELKNSPRNIKNEAYESFRFLLKEDGLGLTMTDIVLQPNIENTYGYQNNLEIAYCLEGRAKLVEILSEKVFLIEPGTLWVAPAKNYFRFIAEVPTRLICIFSPALKGQETGIAELKEP